MLTSRLTKIEVYMLLGDFINEYEESKKRENEFI